MKLEVGKYYLCRDRSKIVMIESVTSGISKLFRIRGSIVGKGGEKHFWMENGRYKPTISGHELDLVGEVGQLLFS